MSVLTSQGSQEWYTPNGVIELARKTMGTIDLDPASNTLAQTWIKAKEYRTLDLTGFDPNPLWSKERLASELKQRSITQLKAQAPWHGSVWLNPPFDSTPHWVTRLRLEYFKGNIFQGMLLVNTATGYEWYEELWRIAPVCCLRRRLSFVDASGVADPRQQAKKGQTIAYFGDNVDRFAELWLPYGRILLP